MLIFSEICQLKIHDPFTYDNRKVCEFWVHFASRETCIPKRVHNIPLKKGSRNTSRKKPMRKRQCSKPTLNMYVRRKNNEKYMKKIVGQKCIQKIGKAKPSPRKIGVLKKKSPWKPQRFFRLLGVELKIVYSFQQCVLFFVFFTALFPTIVVHCFW